MNAYRTKMMLSLGSVIQAQVDIHTVIPSVKSGAHLLCATHTKRVNQFYRCEEGEELAWGDLARGIETTEGWKVQTDPPPKSAADKTIPLTPVPLNELLEHTFEGPAIYYLVPNAAAANQVWQVLAQIVKRGKIALISKMALGERQNEKMWRLDLFRGYLVLRELVYPEVIKSVPEIPEAKIDKQISTLVDQFVENLVSSWDSFDSSDPNVKRFDAWIQAGTTVAGPEVQVKEVSPAPLLDSLRHAVETTKKSRPRTKAS